MPFRVDEMLVLDIGYTRFPDGTKLETSTSIARVLVVESFPAVLNWRLAIKFTCDVRCTVACDAHVVDPGGRSLPAGHLKFLAEERIGPRRTAAAGVHGARQRDLFGSSVRGRVENALRLPGHHGGRRRFAGVISVTTFNAELAEPAETLCVSLRILRFLR